MDAATLKKSGICFDFCRDAVVPEIPCVQDVLFALRLSDQQENYDFCLCNHPTYIVNVGLVMAAVGYDVLCMERYDEALARKIIARVIIELCPAEARCLFRRAYIQAMRVAGEATPPKNARRGELTAACTCPACRRRVREESGHSRPVCYED